MKNIKIDRKKKYVLFSINPTIYPLDIVYSAAYIMIDRAYILLDGNPKKEIKVEIRAKNKQQSLRQLVYDFNSELLNYAVYKQQAERNKGLREIILQRALLTNLPKDFFKKKNVKKKK